jgi:hypothetical protein
VVLHLIHGERTDWIARARIILSEGAARPFEPFDRVAHLRPEAAMPLAAALDEFARLRAANLETLAGWRIGEPELALAGEHPALGAVTLRQLLATWTAHDLGHLVQVARTMARRHADEVGPWRDYLSILGGA